MQKGQGNICTSNGEDRKEEARRRNAISSVLLVMVFYLSVLARLLDKKKKKTEMHSQHLGVKGKKVKTNAVSLIEFWIDPKGLYRSNHSAVPSFSNLYGGLTPLWIINEKVDDIGN